MIHKRPFIDESAYEVAHKHPRRWDNNNQLAPVMDVASDGVHQGPCASGDEEFGKSQSEGRVTKVLNGTDEEFMGTSGCMSHFWWVDGNILEGDSELDAAVHLSFFPEFSTPADQLRAFLQSDEIYSSCLDCPSPKLVPVGPEHQADIPELGLQSLNKCADNLGRLDAQIAQSSNSGLMIEDGNEGKLMGTCVIPMPEIEALADHGFESWETRTECKCSDFGSVRCVRQHVMEARESLRKNLGQELFEELGLCDMGEEVAKKWMEEEEQAFHLVVQSNPATLGKNFWDNLSEVFPSRTKKDLVSYYFNVFMLRKRAEQNRFEPLNIDSDNDEWERTENGNVEEDEDSVVESLTSHGFPTCYLEGQRENCLEDNEDDGEVNVRKDFDDAAVHGVTTDEEDEGDLDHISGLHVENLVSVCGGAYQLVGKIQRKTSNEYDIQDDSCTSYECLQDKVDYSGPPDMGSNTRQSSEE